MYVIDEVDSARLEERMKTGRKSIVEMNLECHRYAHPLSMKFGDLFAFNSHVLHGTLVNETNRTRVSFDFRILVDGDDRGIKDPSFFIRPNERTGNAATVRACIYFGKNRGFTRIISQKYQLLVCLRYASDQRFNAQVAETELNGFDHHPNLWDMVCGTRARAMDALILFSVQLLPPDYGDRTRLLDEATQRGLPLHFVCEDFVLSPGQSREEIDAAFEHGSASRCE